MGRSDRAPGEAALQLCLACGSHYVAPVESLELGDGGRLFELRCGECGVWRRAVAPPGAARALERALADDLAAMTDAVERLDRERMSTEVDAFIAALDRGLLDPGDFGTPGS
jgi:hypothetical protein